MPRESSSTPTGGENEQSEDTTGGASEHQYKLLEGAFIIVSTITAITAWVLFVGPPTQSEGIGMVFAKVASGGTIGLIVLFITAFLVEKYGVTSSNE